VEKDVRSGQTTDVNITRRTLFGRRLTKPTDIHSECVILIAFPRRKLSRERALVLRHTYIACLVKRYSGRNLDDLQISRDSSVGIATRYGLEGPGIESRWGDIFRSCQYWPWGPPSLLYNGCRNFPGGKFGRGVALTTHPF
jgi:hypothetical protein